MKKLLAMTTAGMLAVTLLIGSAKAFYDEIVNLKKELSMYETAHATDFSDVLDQLGEMSGSVFSDVKNEDWFQPYITSLAEWQIVSGYRNAKGKLTGEFHPEKPVTIAEALKITMSAAKVDIRLCAETPNHRQAIGHWATQYVSCGEQMKLRVLADGSIDLNRSATRAEVIGLIFDVFRDSVPPMLSPYRDVSRSPYESDIAYATTLGIVSGDKNASGESTGTFRPNMSINRAEVSKIVYERLKIEARRTLAVKEDGV